jgi:small subunit ribosomal protein S4e
MYQTRETVSRKVPISRKGPKYVARPSSHLSEAVPVVVAIRDMLKLAMTSKEVKIMINKKLLEINNRPVKDVRESIKIFNVLKADKNYTLSILPTHRYTLKETKTTDRLCKIINKKLLKNNKIQLNLHDGSNVLSDKKEILVGDSITIDSKSKIKSHTKLKEGAKAFIIKGKYAGSEGKITKRENQKITVEIEKEAKVLPMENIIVS